MCTGRLLGDFTPLSRFPNDSPILLDTDAHVCSYIPNIFVSIGVLHSAKLLDLAGPLNELKLILHSNVVALA
jgi:hypothetical protein